MLFSDEDEEIIMTNPFKPGTSSGESRSENIFQAMGHLKSALDPRPAPRVGRGEVRTAVLALLAEQPMHGYQMIQEIELRTAGQWKPSAGSIYPTLQLLTDAGLITAEEANGRKTYSLTEEGSVQGIDAAASAPWVEQDKRGNPAFRQLPKASVGLAQAVGQIGQSGTTEQVEQAIELLDETRRKLYAILAQ